MTFPNVSSHNVPKVKSHCGVHYYEVEHLSNKYKVLSLIQGTGRQLWDCSLAITLGESTENRIESDH